MSEINGVEIEVVKDYEAMSQAAASHILERLVWLPHKTLLVPTGTTPPRMYEILSGQPQETFEGVTLYNFDEYYEPSGDEQGFKLLDADNPQGYQHYMARHLLDAQPAIKSYFPGAENIGQKGHYDMLIAINGGIDLCVNAIGEDGHTFGFNFPGTHFGTRTRGVDINESTIAVNERLTGSEVPRQAVTTGLQTGMDAREVIVLVSGTRKAQVLREIITGEVSRDLPATVLRGHHNCKWIVDEAAASQL